MDEVSGFFIFIFTLFVAGVILYLIIKYDKKYQYNTKKEESSDNIIENNDNSKAKTECAINVTEEKKDNSQKDKMDFKSFLKLCDEIIDKINNYPISNETREELEFCYELYGKDVNDFPFSIIIQSDIIRFLYIFKCRIYTAVLNQERNIKDLKFFDTILPKDSVDCAMNRILVELYSNNYNNITLNEILPSMVFLSHFLEEVTNSKDFSSLIEKKNYTWPANWVLVVVAYINILINQFFKFGIMHAKKYEYSNARKCLDELIELSLKTKNQTSRLNSNINNEPLLSTQTQKRSDYKTSHTKSTLDKLLNELNSLIGLSTVKEEVNTLINLVTVGKEREAQGLKPVPLSLHLVFSGNPGTGKTTVARILAKIYKELGILSQGQLIETDRSGLVAGYVGQTALKTQEVIEQASGGILFIDEAYSLASSRDSNDFGKEAIDTLLKAMEDMRDDFIVIVAGYPDLMKQFLKSNPGLESRFNNFINFEDYQPSDLVEIFKHMCKEKDFIISEKLNSSMIEYFNKLYSNRDDSYANARTVRNVFENAIKKQANRVASLNNRSKKDLQELLYEDLF